MPAGVDHLDMQEMARHLGVTLSIGDSLSRERRGEYAALPNNPGWAIYRGHSVRDGDCVVAYSAADPRSVILRTLDVVTDEIASFRSLRREIGWSHLAGSAYYADEVTHKALHRRQAIVLRRRPDNPFDASAIEVYAARIMIGHLEHETAVEYAELFDAGGVVACQIRSLLNPSVPDKNDLAMTLPDPLVLRAMLT